MGTGKSPQKNESGRRGAGSNKSRRKKREYKAHIHTRLADGQVNDARGSWVSTSQLDSKVAQRATMQANRFAGRSRVR